MWGLKCLAHRCKQKQTVTCNLLCVGCGSKFNVVTLITTPILETWKLRPWYLRDWPRVVLWGHVVEWEFTLRLVGCAVTLSQHSGSEGATERLSFFNLNTSWREWVASYPIKPAVELVVMPHSLVALYTCLALGWVPYVPLPFLGPSVKTLITACGVVFTLYWNLT